MREQHIIPLSRQVIALLQGLRPLTQYTGILVFVAAQIIDSGGTGTRQYFPLYAGCAAVDEPSTNKHYTPP